jgi:hypothetical protein
MMSDMPHFGVNEPNMSRKILFYSFNEKGKSKGDSEFQLNYLTFHDLISGLKNQKSMDFIKMNPKSIDQYL